MTVRPVQVRFADLAWEQVRPGVRRCGFAGSEAMTVLNELQPGMEPRSHRHDMEQLALVLEGRVRFVVDGEEFEVGEGEAILIPGGVEHHGETVGDRRALNLDVFAPPREDYAHLTTWMDDGVA